MTAVATRTREARFGAPSSGGGLTVGYVRISRDREGRELGVDRQDEDCTRLAGIMNLALAEIVRENDKSASTYASEPRPLWDSLIERVQRGEVSHIVAATLSRLTRGMIEREELLALRHVGLSVTTAAGQRIYPTMSAAEVHMIRMLGANDTAESDYISERTRRAFDQSAAKGTPHGPIAYGWDRHRERGGDVVDTINAAQAEVIREAATRILAGETIRGIARDLNAREIPAPRGGRWSTTILTKIVRRERNAARRVHRGVVVGPAAWEPILDDDTFDAVVSLLNDPARRTNKIGAAPRYLLSGLIVCGKCHDTRVWVQHAAKPTTAPGYHCKSCHGLRRKAKSLDEHVIEAICARMARPDALDWLAQDANVLSAARAHLSGLQAQASQLSDAFVEGVISIEQMTRANATLLPAIEAARVAVENARPIPDAVRTLAGHDSIERVRKAWDLLNLDQQRAVVRALLTITLLPTQRRKFDADAVVKIWRTDLADPVARTAPAPF